MAESDAFYQEIVAEVDPILEELGTTYQVRSNESYDPNTLTTTPGTNREVIGLVADQQFANSLGQMGGSEADLSWINSKTLILQASADPKDSEEILVDGKWFPLSKVVPIKPADITVVFMLDVSR